MRAFPSNRVDAMKFVAFCLAFLACVLHAECQNYPQFIKGINWKQPSKKVGLTASEKKYLLDLHNLYRQTVALGKFNGKPKAANMELMTWCDECAKDAQEWANNCGGPPHGNHKGQGQNMAASMPYNIIFSSAFKGWCDKESTLWQWGSNGLGYTRKAGHYSQVVWATSNKVGCGFNACEGGWARLICNFKPPGNFNYHINPMYLVGEPCSKCPSGKKKCINGALCAPKGAKAPNYPLGGSSGGSSSGGNTGGNSGGNFGGGSNGVNDDGWFDSPGTSSNENSGDYGGDC